MKYKSVVQRNLASAMGDIESRNAVLSEIGELGRDLVDVLSRRVVLPLKHSVGEIPLLPSEVRSGVSNGNSYVLTLTLSLSDGIPYFINVLSCNFQQNSAYPCIIRYGDAMKVCQDMKTVKRNLSNAIKNRLAFILSQCVLAEHISSKESAIRSGSMPLSNSEPVSNQLHMRKGKCPKKLSPTMSSKRKKQ